MNPRIPSPAVDNQRSDTTLDRIGRHARVAFVLGFSTYAALGPAYGRWIDPKALVAKWDMFSAKYKSVCDVYYYAGESGVRIQHASLLPLDALRPGPGQRALTDGSMAEVQRIGRQICAATGTADVRARYRCSPRASRKAPDDGGHGWTLLMNGQPNLCNAEVPR